MAERQDEARLVAWNRGVRADVELSLDLGIRTVHIGLPTSEVHLAASVGRDRDWLLRTARDLVALAKDRGAFVSISAEDLARTDMSFLQDYAGTVAEAGADRLRLSDTIGYSRRSSTARGSPVWPPLPPSTCSATRTTTSGSVWPTRSRSPGGRPLLPRHGQRYR